MFGLHFHVADPPTVGQFHLHFGIPSEGPAPLTAVITAIAPAAESAGAAFIFWPTITAAISAIALTPLSHIRASLWYRLRRDSRCAYTLPVPALAGNVAAWGTSARERAGTQARWTLPEKAAGSGISAWSHFEQPYHRSTSRWSLFSRTGRASKAHWQRFLTSEVPRRVIWTAPTPALWKVSQVRYDLAPAHERREPVRWTLFSRLAAPARMRWDYAPLVIFPNEVIWGRFFRRSWNGFIPSPRPPNPLPAPTPSGPFHLFFHSPSWPVPPEYHFRLHFGRKYYVARYGINMITELGLFKLPNLEPIRFQNLSIDAAIDSHSRLLRAIIKDEASFDLLQPDTDLEPVEIRAVLNGYAWDFVVKEVGGSVGFADRTFTASAESSLIYLGAPYAPARDYLETYTRTAHQLADQEIENLGFELEWDTVDWVVPPQVWSYQNLTPLEALKRLASTVGGYVMGDRTARKVYIRPQYAIEPWLWPLQIPLTTITASQAKALATQNQRYDNTNRIVVSGGNVGKVRVVAVRSGTAGDHSQNTYTDTLICDVDAGTERTRQMLSAAGRHRDVILSGIPLAPTPEPPGLIEMGDLVEVVWGNETPWIGMVIGVKVDAAIGSLLMTLTLDRFLEA